MSSAPAIVFPCHCGHVFRLPADQAASTVQCPKCGRLNDVPTLSDLENISADDGTLLLKPSERKAEPHRLADVNRAFRPTRVDVSGNDIDLRNTQDDLANIGAPKEIDEIPLQDEDVRPTKPKYDPITGELIRPINIVKPARPEQKVVPVARRALTYAAGDTAHIMNARRILVQMFMPQNVVVMVFVFFFILIYKVTVGLLGFYLFNMIGMMPTLYTLPAALLLMSHYANTVEDNGPEAIDELPRPLRQLHLGEDLYTPFCNMFMSLALCFAPAAICYQALPPKFTGLAALPLVLGFFFFPATFMTAVTGGTVLNLRPDRLAAVIRASGGQYAIAFFAWLIALPLFAFSLFGVYMIPFAVRENHNWIYNGNRPVVEFPVMFVATVVLHFASWHLGLLYRKFHDDFPWVLQKHVSVRRQNEAAKAAEIRAQRRKPRYVK